MMDKNWLCFHPAPKKPAFPMPAGAVDAHCHVFGPAEEFPYAPERKYTPCDASKAQLFALRDHLGIARNVIVQASCHGRDNAALVDALQAADGRARGVAVVGPDILDAELQSLHIAGVRGVRFAFLKRLGKAAPKPELLKLAARVAKLGWHVVVYFEADALIELTPFLEALPCAVVVDHMGRPDMRKALDGADFQRFTALMRRNKNIHVKVSCPERLTHVGPPYSDVIPYARHLVETFPDRVLWGTDWPHPNMKSHMPDDGQLVDLIPEIAPTKALQQALLVDNPMRLYWPEGA